MLFLVLVLNSSFLQKNYIHFYMYYDTYSTHFSMRDPKIDDSVIITHTNYGFIEILMN